MTEATSPTTSDELSELEIIDVWSRTSPKYRTRAIVLLIVNAMLFAGLGCFAYWLRTGQFLAPAMDGYWRLFAETFMPRGDATLANFTLFPIRLDVIPLHGVVVGLLLAALVSIPILISILYRFPCSVPFVLIVAFLAVMPWLAINLAGACILASLKPFRFRFRYASALLGLLLVLLYFYGASRESTSSVAIFRPEDRIKFMAPWVLAAIASCVIMGGVLFLAKVVNYRPGVVAPLLLVSFAVPVALFEAYVGRDELYYRLVERRFQDSFVDRDVNDWFERLVHKAWRAKPEPRPPLEVVRELVDFRIGLELAAVTDLRTPFTQMRQDLISEYDRFIRHFPDSRYAPNVLYLKAKALDMRIDLSAFRNKKLLRYHDDFPSDRSEFIWRQVVANAPNSSVSAVGRYKLAVIGARKGHLGQAIEALGELIAKYDPARPSPEPANSPGTVKKILERAPADASLKISVEQTVFEAKRFLALLWENGKDPLCGVRPFCGSRPGEPYRPGLFTLDPRHPQYEKNLRSIVTAYPKCLLSDNLVLNVAMLADDPDERIVRLNDCIERFPNGDARAEALFRLGLAYLEADSNAKARESLEALLQAYPDDKLWTPLARERLRVLLPVAAEDTP